MSTTETWSRRPLLLGVIHLAALPGAPGHTAGTAPAQVLDPAVEDARRLVEAGFDGVILENFGDVPFFPSRVPPETIAAMAVAAAGIRAALPRPHLVGVNVLRNDALAALGIAAACDLDFIRVNVLTGAVVTDQGVIEGQAAELMRARQRIAPDVHVLADVRVKHGAPLVQRPLEEEAAELVQRAGAGGVIVTGAATGLRAERSEVARVRAAVPGSLLLVGSGFDVHNARSLLEVADGAIVGTSIKVDARTTNRVDVERARALVDAVRG